MFVPPLYAKVTPCMMIICTYIVVTGSVRYHSDHNSNTNTSDHTRNANMLSNTLLSETLIKYFGKLDNSCGMLF